MFDADEPDHCQAYFRQIAAWLADFPHAPFHEVYYAKWDLWNDLSIFISELLSKRHPFGDDLFDTEAVYDLLRHYVKICAQFLQADADMMSISQIPALNDSILVSYPHLRNLQAILGHGNVPLYRMLEQIYHADVRSMHRRLLVDFIKQPTNGIKHLLALAQPTCATTDLYTRAHIALWSGVVLNPIVQILGENVHQEGLTGAPTFHRQIVRVFHIYDHWLQDPTQIVGDYTSGMAVQQFALLLDRICKLDGNTCIAFARQLLPPAFLQEAKSLVGLISLAWRFRILKKYVEKGRMETRVMAVTAMCDALVDTWRTYNQSPGGLKEHPIGRFLADFLIEQRVFDYLVSVDAHPNIISRGGHIVGFLVVCGRYGKSHTDAIWRFLSDSQDPWVVAAIVKMLTPIISLLHQDDLLYLCNKLYELPLESYTADIIHLNAQITEHVMTKEVDWAHTDYAARPWNVCVRLIQNTAPGRESSHLSPEIYQEACKQLNRVAMIVNPDCRKEIYLECAENIAVNSSKATGSIHVLWLLCGSSRLPVPTDSDFFGRRQEIVTSFVEELCSFVRDLSERGHFTNYLVAFEYRLQLLCMFLFRIPGAVGEQLYSRIWDHLLGPYASDNHIRDRAWCCFAESLRLEPRNEFCGRLITDYVQVLDPRYFTPRFLDFVESFLSSAIDRIEPLPKEEGKPAMYIAWTDLLWRILMTAPPGTIEDRAATLLADRYVNVSTGHGNTLEQVEDAHVQLAEKCVGLLTSARQRLAEDSAELETVTEGSRMDIVAPQDDQLSVARTVLLVKLMLDHLRTKPKFSRKSQLTVRPEPKAPAHNRGETIKVLYTSNNSTSTKEPMLVGTTNTLRELESRLCEATGFTKVNLFCSGQRLNHASKLDDTLSSLGVDNNAFLLVQKAAGSETRLPLGASTAGGSKFEAALMSHFEPLFDCMSSDDGTSEEVFGLLMAIPFPDRFAVEVVNGTASTETLFPLKKPFQAEYAAIALRRSLQEQLQRDTLDETFLQNGVRQLSDVIISPQLLNPTVSKKGLRLPSVLVKVLLAFLKERPQSAISAHYFADVSALVDRLLLILDLALKDSTGDPSVAQDAYAAILEASLHSRAVWETFDRRPEISRLHETLLLTDSRKALREGIARSIASVCDGDLPMTSPVTNVETTARFWQVLSGILPRTLDYASQSEQLFYIAEQVFRANDSNSERIETELRSHFVDWGRLLLRHTHMEYVGRHEVDHVVLGFTKLLACCVSSLKSFKNRLQASHLMASVYQKFLFPKVEEIHDDQETAIPVLESAVRQELYDLVLALVEDDADYRVLLELAESSAMTPGTESFHDFKVDRELEIRSPTGYCGLDNPRAICYMNSLMTQLFMNVDFRKFLLNVDTSGSTLLQETRSLFGRLQNSFRKAVDPRRFAESVRGIDTQPIDVNIQMDADEFYNLLFDQLEGEMTPIATKRMFRSFYGGQTLTQIKSRECDHVSERHENFLVVGCVVQGKANLQQSLEAFVEGDMMEGENKYKCESCGGKLVQAVKRTCIKDVADNVIFQLKRFEYDLEIGVRTKINDHFSFPSEIDMSPYKVEYLSDPSKPRTPDIFELVGILDHTGTTENGHYYSFIRERPCSSGGASNWVEFNDREVTEFDPQTIPMLTYGGRSEELPNTLKSNNAYMLFYQRRTAIETNHREYTRTPLGGPTKVPMPKHLEQEIATDNAHFLREYCLYDPNHSKFVRQALSMLRTIKSSCSDGHFQEHRALQIVLSHLCSVVARQADAEAFESAIKMLRKTAFSCSTCCLFVMQWLLHDRSLWAMLMRCPNAQIRSLTQEFFVDGLKCLREKDPFAYHGLDEPDSDDSTSLSRPLISQVASKLHSLLELTNQGVRGWEELYSLLFTMASMGHEEVGALLDHGILIWCLHVLEVSYKGSRVPPIIEPHNVDLVRVIGKRKKTVLRRPIELLWKLLSYVNYQEPDVADALEVCPRSAHYDHAHHSFPLVHDEIASLGLFDEAHHRLAVLDEILATYDMSNPDVPTRVVTWLLSNCGSDVQQKVFHTICNGIDPAVADGHRCTLAFVSAALAYCMVSTNDRRIAAVIDIVATAARDPNHPCAEHFVRFFHQLLSLQHQSMAEHVQRELFYKQGLAAAGKYAVALLENDAADVRELCQSTLQKLFKDTDVSEFDNEVIEQRAEIVRRLGNTLNQVLITEHSNGASRTIMAPMIETREMLNTLHEEDMGEGKSIDDEDFAIIECYKQDVSPRITAWPVDSPVVSVSGMSDSSGLLNIQAADFDAGEFDASEYGTTDDEIELGG
ncbi:hypothetical protein M011DRAFT_104769 [Sporormia fimetaria CBS 119925]|uniref:USP domain-containing protein n=1 Tax=Sporormia fimetaria CBS 119925 TaxID=1340428 RepID=A0A6A6VPR2_9PLEO|nr:hypothetical protein M011DRAFT_104769 [Sporormia fimetaria CBS 119925]